MPDRIPHAPGKETPAFIDSALQQFGNNQYGEPNFRLIWSERPLNYLLGEYVPTYEYLNPPRWVLERFLTPERFAGPRAQWGAMQEALSGPYPSQGAYFICDPQFPVDWHPSEENVRLMCVALLQTQAVDEVSRRNAKVDSLQKQERTTVLHNAETLMETYTSADLGKIVQAASGPKNNFRTAEDWERDRDKQVRLAKKFRLPRFGGKIYETGA